MGEGVYIAGLVLAYWAPGDPGWRLLSHKPVGGIRMLDRRSNPQYPDLAPSTIDAFECYDTRDLCSLGDAKNCTADGRIRTLPCWQSPARALSARHRYYGLCACVEARNCASNCTRARTEDASTATKCVPPCRMLQLNFDFYNASTQSLLNFDYNLNASTHCNFDFSRK